jgi:tRNA-2-methylthio-N6-dimethylallyladenosine synthase
MPPEWTVSDAVVTQRFDRLLSTVRGLSRDRNLTRLGERTEILLEKQARDGEMLQGRTRDFKTVMVPADAGVIGQMLHVELTGTTGATFTGTPLRSRVPLPMAVSG